MSPAAGATRRRPDASMTLLREVMERPLDPGYASAAAARRTGTAPPATRPRRAVTAGLGLLAGLLAVVGVVQLRAPGAEGTTAALRAEVEQRQGEVDALASAVEGARADVVGAQDAVLGPEASEGGERAQQLGAATGAVAVTGPGLRVVVDDAPDARADASGSPRTDAQADLGRVRDRDLQVVVNGLWSAGAEAVAVGGQRLTARTAVRGAGEAVLVGYQPLAPPYEVEAVGDPDALATGFARSAGGRYAAGLADYGITVSVDEVDELHLPAAAGLRPEAARVLDADGGSPP
ncbi:DUF881 domain-containing protein [uncultured Pseudokineococcus sp.]|uniref:DUF881 domain-containing protein n=1 Tax=uncultured Pseudokineococcus sp. TaxID=1642928 RepID=UPI0026098A07|nr:DUF881 domain-containing protein [uncultured Pseudokineococcus sp.]